MSPEPITEGSLMALCHAHYGQTRRIPTSLAVPPGTIENLKALITEDRRYPGNTTVILRLPYSTDVTTLEELTGCTHPEVLSDANPVASRPPPPPSPLFVFWNAGHGWTKWKHIERLPGATETWCGKSIPMTPVIVHRDSVAVTTEICPECLLAYSRSP